MRPFRRARELLDPLLSGMADAGDSARSAGPELPWVRGCPRHHVIIHGLVMPVTNVSPDQIAPVRARVGELPIPGGVPGRPDVRDIRLQIFIKFELAAGRKLDAGFV